MHVSEYVSHYVQQSRSSAWRSQLALRMLGENFLTFVGMHVSEYVSQQSRFSAWRSQLALRMLGENLLTFFGTDMSEYVSHYVETTEQIFSMA